MCDTSGMETTNLLTIRMLAQRLKLPATWLRTEAQAGRIPYLKAGQRMLFNAEAVERVLLDRAAGTTPQKVPDEE